MSFPTMTAAKDSPTKTFHFTTYPSLSPSRPELSASGKTIVVTGGGTGIGASVATYFARAGASRIALLGRRPQPLLDTKASIEATYPNTSVLAIPADLTSSEAVTSAFVQISAGGKIHVLVSNAAVAGALKPISEAKPEELMDGVFTNLRIAMNVTSAFLAHRVAEGGVIIDTNSCAAHMHVAPGFSSYQVAKTAVARYFSCVQFEQPDLSVFSVQPGAVLTDMNREAGYQEQKEGEEFLWTGPGMGLLARHTDASLPASFYVWLASPEATFLKGKYLWAGWDVEELKARRSEIEGTEFLSMGLQGWPFA
jgi:NAD(P)-dependent dehydrogenase (short-subunit alcohol dehydrogenase family)